MLEAMSAGCVVLASDTPPVREVIEEGANGLLFSFHSPDALAQRAIEVLKRPASFRKLAAAARATAIERFDFDSVALPGYTRLISELTHWE